MKILVMEIKQNLGSMSSWPQANPSAGSDRDRGHRYEGGIFALATHHGKGPLVAPAFRDVLGVRVVEIDVDTDTLGTFAGEVARTGSQLETAIAKARMGMAVSGLPRGLANEGAFGAHPVVPFVTVDLEMMVLVDDDLGIVVSESEAATDVATLSIDVEPDQWSDLDLRGGGFPGHGMIVRPTGAHWPVVKGIHDLDTLAAAVSQCAQVGVSPTVRIESDLRAHHHPGRRAVIARAAKRLADRLATCCPSCSLPGFGTVRIEAGAPCAACGEPTPGAALEHRGCARCDHTETRSVAPESGADPSSCPACNP